MFYSGFPPAFQVSDGFLIKIYQAPMKDSVREGTPDSLDEESNSFLSAVYLVEPVAFQLPYKSSRGPLVFLISQINCLQQSWHSAILSSKKPLANICSLTCKVLNFVCGVDSHITDIVVTYFLSGSIDRHRNTSDGDTTGATLTLFDPMTHMPLGLVPHLLVDVWSADLS